MDVQHVNRLHSQAMNYAEQAIEVRRRGDVAEAARLFRLAFADEREAAELVAKHSINTEPTRSILLRSAATLACDCGERADATRLIALCRAGDPPGFIEDQLREIESDLNEGEASFVPR